MRITTSIAALQDALLWRSSHQSLGLIIVRGALHRGHKALIEHSVASCEVTVVTCCSALTVPNKPLESVQLEEAGVDLLFAPEPEVFAPQGADAAETAATRVVPPHVDCSALAGAERDTCQQQLTLIVKLCNLIRPTTLFYGEKHFQRLHLLERTLADLNLDTTVQRVPVIREADGLAVGSQNGALSASAREQAALLHQTLDATARAIARGDRDFDQLQRKARIELRNHRFRTEYVTICDAANLLPPSAQTQEFRVLGGVQLGNVGLYDNVPA